MRKKLRGFTLIEVSLFLAITGLVFVGIVAGTQTSIFQQRYNDAVQNFADFLRNNYAQVMNVQSEGAGNSEYAIFGRMIVFDGGEIKSYSVIGKADVNSGGTVIEQLKNAEAIVGGYKEGDVFKGAGLTESYTPRWDAKIQNSDGDGEEFVGAVMIVRHPETGSVYTYMTTENAIGNKINSHLGISDEWGFDSKQVDFCVNPNGGSSSVRKDVRIVEDAKNTSGVILVPDNEGVCN